MSLGKSTGKPTDGAKHAEPLDPSRAARLRVHIGLRHTFHILAAIMKGMHARGKVYSWRNTVLSPEIRPAASGWNMHIRMSCNCVCLAFTKSGVRGSRFSRSHNSSLCTMARPPLRQLNTSVLKAERRKPGPKPKPLEERSLPIIKPYQRIERSYTRERKIQILCFLFHYQVLFVDADGVEKTRGIKHSEVASIFLVPRCTSSTWWVERNKIIQCSTGQRTMREVFVCQWPEMEVKLFTAFVK